MGPAVARRQDERPDARCAARSTVLRKLLAPAQRHVGREDEEAQGDVRLEHEQRGPYKLMMAPAAFHR